MTTDKDAYKNLNAVFLINNSQVSQHCSKAGYLSYHPERRFLVPKLQCLKSVSWMPLVNLVEFSLVVLEGVVYLIGGFDTETKKYKRNILRYHFQSGRWHFCAKMITRRSSFTAFVHDKRIYFAGGFTQKDVLTDQVEYFEPSINQCYEESANLPRPCAHYGAISTERSEVYILGGLVAADTLTESTAQAKQEIVLSNQLWSLVKRRKTEEGNIFGYEMAWTEVAAGRLPMKPGIMGHQCIYCQHKQRIYVVGGTTDKSNEKPTKYSGFFYLELNDIRPKRPAIKKISQQHAPKQSVTSINEEQIAQEARIARRKISEQNMGKSIDKQEVVHQAPEASPKLSPKKSVTPWRKRDVPGFERYGAFACIIDNKFCVIGGDKIKPTATTADWKPNDIGYFDIKRKEWHNEFSLTGCGIGTSNIKGIVLSPEETSKEFKEDRMNWLLQWALW